MIHIWPFFAAVLPEGRQAIDRMASFIKKHAAPGEHIHCAVIHEPPRKSCDRDRSGAWPGPRMLCAWQRPEPTLQYWISTSMAPRSLASSWAHPRSQEELKAHACKASACRLT